MFCCKNCQFDIVKIYKLLKRGIFHNLQNVFSLRNIGILGEGGRGGVKFEKKNYFSIFVISDI